jgi:3-phenylpropionate/trans-cinnamate dioxygenase ferredoxin subunit
MMPFVFKNERILVTRTSQGLFAVQEKCPHNGASLLKGFCTKNNEVVCPLHRYSFDLASGKATSGGSYTLKTYPISEKEDGWYIGIKASWWEM